MLKLAPLAAALAATMILTGCSTTPSTDATNLPAPVVVPEPTGTPGTTSNIGQTELQLNAELLTAEIPAGQAIYLRGTVMQKFDGWTGTIVPATAADRDVIIFSNGGKNADGTESIPAIQALKPGKVTLLLVNSADPATTITIHVTVTSSAAYEEMEGNFTIPDEERLTIQQQAEAFAKTVIGMSEEAANKAIYNGGFQARVVSRDGAGLPSTTDFVQTRINLTIEDGVVTSTTVG